MNNSFSATCFTVKNLVGGNAVLVARYSGCYTYDRLYFFLYLVQLKIISLQRLHCGCAASRSLIVLLDNGGVQCVNCAKNSDLNPVRFSCIQPDILIQCTLIA